MGEVGTAPGDTGTAPGSRGKAPGDIARCNGERKEGDPVAAFSGILITSPSVCICGDPNVDLLGGDEMVKCDDVVPLKPKHAQKVC